MGQAKRLLTVILVGLPATALPAAAHAATPELPPDTPRILTLPPSNGHRIFALDSGSAHAVDGKIHVINGDSWAVEGNLPNGFFGTSLLAADGRTIYSTTTYFSRGDHGSRTDLVEYFGSRDLALQGETILPPKRAQTTWDAAYLQESRKAAYLLVQNATPASSVTVLSLATRKVLAEIPTAGCIGIYPSATEDGRFSSLCGDGAAITISFDATGHETARQRSAKFFDPDGDPLFVASVPVAGQKTLFVSFLGHAQTVDFTGPVAHPDAAWPFVTGADAAANWRPGGYQLVAYNQANNQFFVTMHANGSEGSHKQAADEIWRVDLAKHGVTARGPGASASFITLSPGPQPKLFASNLDTGTITRLNPDTLAIESASPDHGIVEGGGLLELQ